VQPGGVVSKTSCADAGLWRSELPAFENRGELALWCHISLAHALVNIPLPTEHEIWAAEVLWGWDYDRFR